ncbi:hypothetical protein NDN08_008017 [Rhodosorus marinus]|uniref:Uncharacterized protein n=1 Tax=Rhodosorus marinus TaxID=101924 RepID=A0AAV8V0U0_9RHOD|nr:hypothetical protein NDN08_008017 [Rhodosorus marinus]
MSDHRHWSSRRLNEDYDDLHDNEENSGWQSMMKRQGRFSRKRSRSRSWDSRSQSPRERGRDYDRSLSPYNDWSPRRTRHSRTPSPGGDYDSPGGRRRVRSPPYHERRHKRNERPSRTLMVRNLCDNAPGAIIEREQVEAFFTAYAKVVNVRIPLDRNTRAARGYAFVEFDSLEATRSIMEYANENNGLDFGGRRLNLEYSFSETSGAPTGGDWICSNCSYTNFSRRETCHNCSLARTSDATEVVHDSDPTRANIHRREHPTGGYRGNRPNRPNRKGPNPASFVYDSKSGWYYDPQTRYYVIDAAKNIFYDGTSRKYFRYDVGINCYVPTEYTPANSSAQPPVESSSGTVSKVESRLGAPQENEGKQGTDGSAAGSSGDSKKPPEDTPKNEEVQKTSPHGNPSIAGTTEAQPEENSLPKDSASTATAEPEKKSAVNFALKKGKGAVSMKSKLGKVNADLQRWNTRQQELQQAATEVPAPASLSAANAAPVNPVKDAKQPEVVPVKEATESFIARSGGKVICSLCRRGFKSMDIAQRHEKESALHKQNLEEKRKQQKLYRDRAAERRSMFPQEETQQGKEQRPHPRHTALHPKEPNDAETPQEAPNVGNKLLKAMGWKEGKGLGVSGSGISAPVEATTTSGRAGLGSEPVNTKFALRPGESYKERHIKLMGKRWQENYGDEQ